MARYLLGVGAISNLAAAHKTAPTQVLELLGMWFLPLSLPHIPYFT